MQLLERGPIQLELSHLLHDAAGGQGRLAFLGGEAGIGKSALVQRFGELVAGRARIVVGACDPLTTPRPLGPLLDLESRLGARFAELVARRPEKDALFAGLITELAAHRQQPTVVVFEDVHWADEATLDLLRYLGRRIDAVPALVLATYRSDEVSDRHPLRVVLGDLATMPAVRRLTLEPLSLEAVQTLCAGTVLDAAGLHRQTGGNPFFVTEVIAAGGEGIPATVRDAVLARAARLSPDARQALDAAAVLGFRFEPALLERVSGASAEIIDALVGSGALRPDGDRLAFHHELARDALLDALAPHRRSAYHRRALAALRSLDGAADVRRLAHHAEGAGDREAVLEYAPVAAQRARELSAHREAAAQLGRTLRFADGLPAAERAQLWEAYSWECAATDHWEEAIRADHELIALWRAEGNRAREAWSLGFLARCLFVVGQVQEADRANRAGIEMLEQLPPGAELAEGFAVQALTHLMSSDFAGARGWAERAVAAADASGNLRSRILAWNRLGWALLGSGDDDGEQWLLRALDHARAAGIHWDAAGAYVTLGAAWADRYEFARAEPYLADGIRLAEEHELEGNLTWMLSWQALVHLYLGRWDEAEAAAERVTRRARASALTRVAPAVAALARLYVRRGDARAAALLDEALALVEPTGLAQYVAAVRAIRAEAAWLAGDERRVREEASAALELALESRHPWLTGELLCWLQRAGAAVEVPAWIAAPFRLQLAGRWAEAAAEWQRRGCPYEAAQALAETADTAQQQQAFGALEALGAKPGAQRVARRLREAGVRVPRGPHPGTRRTPGQLTRRQLDVLRLLAEGLTDAEIARRLFLSPKTVGHHVSAVLRKLDAQSRTEAAHVASRLGLVRDGETIAEN